MNKFRWIAAIWAVTSLLPFQTVHADFPSGGWHPTALAQPRDEVELWVELDVPPPGVVTPGSTLHLSIRLGNTGTVTATNTLLTLSIPPGVEWGSPHSDLWVQVDGEENAWDHEIGNLGPGEHPPIEIDVTILQDIPLDSTLAFEVKLGSAEYQVEDRKTVTVVQPTLVPEFAHLRVHISADSLSVMPEGHVLLTVDCHNAGPGLAESVALIVQCPSTVTCEPLPPGRSEHTESGIRWQFERIESNGQESATFELIVPDVAPGALTITARIESEGENIVLSEPENSVTIAVQPPPEPEPISATPLPPPTRESEGIVEDVTPSPAPEALKGLMEELDRPNVRPILLIGLFLVLLTSVLLIVLLLRRRPSPAPTPTWSSTPLPKSTSRFANAYLESPVAAGGSRYFQLDKPSVTIGRATDNNLVIDETFAGWESVSRRHARIYQEAGRWIIQDQGSQNGVYVNGRRTGRNLLNDGWSIALGDTEFVFRAGQSGTMGQPDHT